MENIIEIKNLTYKNIFSDFSINLPKNKFISISGSNNSGKTTLAKILDKELLADASISINGKEINEYKITEYYKTVRVVIPKEYINSYETIDEEINYLLDQLFISKEEKNKRIKSIYKNLSLNRIKREEINNLSMQDFIRLQIAAAISSLPKVIIIDDISQYFGEEEIEEIITYFKYLVSTYDLTIIFITSRLEDIIESDYLFIIHESNVILEGNPIDVMKKDNILNRIGIRVPFMIDLSVKLKDYALIDDIELDIERMVDKLWK